MAPILTKEVESVFSRLFVNLQICEICCLLVLGVEIGLTGLTSRIEEAAKYNCNASDAIETKYACNLGHISDSISLQS